MDGEPKESAKGDLQPINHNHKYFGLYDQHSKIAIPLKHILVNAKIHDYIAEVTYSQLYFNNFESKLETEYYFPISSSACFHGFQAKFGTTIIQGVVKEKEQAKQEYEERREQGDTVAYAEISEENYSVMCVKIGNIPPMTEIEIIFSYIERLEISMNKLWRFTLNSYLITDPSSKSHNGNGNNGIAGYPSHRDSKFQDGPELFAWDVKVLIQSRSPITFLKSSSHEVDVKQSELSNIFSAQISLATTKKYAPTKDFILLYATKSVNTPSYLLSPFEDGYCALINFFPTTNYLTFDDAYLASIGEKDVTEDLVSKARGEFIFLIDRSPQNEAIVPLMKKTLTYFLKSLSEESYFNIIGYNEATESPINESVKVTNKAIEETINDTKTFIAAVGGESRILKVLENIGKLKSRPGCPRILFILTPGNIDTPTGKIIQTGRELFQTRIFTIGIGNGSSTDFLKRTALECYGKYEVIRTHAEVSEKIDHLLKTSVMPYFTDFEFKIKDQGLFSYIVPLPKSIGCITPNELVEFFVIFNKKLENIQKTTFSLQFYNNHNQQYEDFEEEINLANSDLSEAVVKLGLKKFCDSLSKKKEVYESLSNDIGEASKASIIENIVALSVKHGVLTSHTAFICVVKEGDDITRQIPVEKITASAVESIKIEEKQTKKKIPIEVQVTDEQTAKDQAEVDLDAMEDLPEIKPIGKQPSVFEEIIIQDTKEEKPHQEEDQLGAPQKIVDSGGKDKAKYDRFSKQVKQASAGGLLEISKKSPIKRTSTDTTTSKLTLSKPSSHLTAADVVLKVKKEEAKQPEKYSTTLSSSSKKPFELSEIPLRPTTLSKSKSLYHGQATPNQQIFAGSRRTKFEARAQMLTNNALKDQTPAPKELSLLGVEQNSEGFWPAIDKIAAILGLNLKTLLDRVPFDLKNIEQKEIIWMTILVIIWCDQRNFENYSRWDTIHEKALAWLHQVYPEYEDHSMILKEIAGIVLDM